MKLNLATDSKLVTLYIDGNELALQELILRHKQRVYSLIYSKVKNKSVADDVFQDTFIKVIKTVKKGNYTEEGKFLPWVMRIANNLVIDYFRQLKRIPKFNSVDDFDVFSMISNNELTIESELIRSQIYSDLEILIQCLPIEQQEVLIGRIYKDLSFKEIAENTGLSINTVLGRMRYALINLRKKIEEKDIVLTY